MTTRESVRLKRRNIRELLTMFERRQECGTCHLLGLRHIPEAPEELDGLEELEALEVRRFRRTGPSSRDGAAASAGR